MLQILKNTEFMIYSLSIASSFDFSTQFWRYRCLVLFSGTMLSLPFRKIRDKVMKGGSKRMLIKITVLGSSGPIRFVVNEDAVVAAVIETALKSYAHEGRFPVIGTKCSDFFLCMPIVGPEALNPRETIGSFGVRNFMLCKKPQHAAAITRKSSSSWKSWFNKTLAPKVSPH